MRALRLPASARQLTALAPMRRLPPRPALAAQVAFTGISATFAPTTALRLQCGAAPPIIAPQQQQQLPVAMEAMQPFSDPIVLKVEFTQVRPPRRARARTHSLASSRTRAAALQPLRRSPLAAAPVCAHRTHGASLPTRRLLQGGVKHSLPLRAPIMPNCFCGPLPLSGPDFIEKWRVLEGGGRDVVQVLNTSGEADVGQVKALLAGGMRMGVVTVRRQAPCTAAARSAHASPALATGPRHARRCLRVRHVPHVHPAPQRREGDGGLPDSR